MRGKKLKLSQERFRYYIRRNITERMVRYQHRLPREMVGSPSLKVFNNHMDVAFGDMV